MRVVKLVWLAVTIVAVSACTSVAPVATPFLSTPVTPAPGASLPTPLASPDGPSASLPSDSAAPSEAATIAPASLSPTPEATPTPTPKPTKKPTPTPSRTAPPISADLEVRIETTTIPNPFYNLTDYQIRVYVAALGTQNVPNAHVKLVAQNEGVSYKFDTGPIAITDSYYHDFTVNVPAIGPSALIASATLPTGYTDTKKTNNSVTIAIDVLPAAP